MITKKGSRIKTGVFFCDRVLVFASHIRYNDRKLFQRERRKKGYEKKGKDEAVQNYLKEQ